MNPQELLEAIALRTTFLMIDIPKNAMHHRFRLNLRAIY